MKNPKLFICTGNFINFYRKIIDRTDIKTEMTGLNTIYTADDAYANIKSIIYKYNYFKINNRCKEFYIFTNNLYEILKINNAIYAAEIAKTNEKVFEIIPKMYTLIGFDIEARWFIDENNYEDMIDKDTGLIAFRQSDDVLDKINDEFTKLLEMEN